MTFTYQIKFRDDGEKQTFDNVRECKETSTEYILVLVDGKQLPFYKNAIEKPVIVTFTPISITPPEN